MQGVYMSFAGKLKINKHKLIVIISIIIFGLAFGGVGMTKYVNASQVKNELVLGNKYLEEGKYEEAILEFQKVIKIEPNNIEARVGLAKAYQKTGKLDDAEKILNEAIGINPKKVDPYLELAELYISENNLVDAIKILTDGYKATNDQSIKTMLDDNKSKITVDNVNKTITLGENYSLPNEVTIKINNIEMQFPVKWEKTTVDVSAAGTQTFTGTLENTDKTVTLTLNVIAIASIEDINSTIKQNDKYSLPSKLTAKMTDNSTREVEVIWDLSTVDTSKAGTYVYQGTVNGYSGKVKLTLTISSPKKPVSENEAFEIAGDIARKKYNEFGLLCHGKEVINNRTYYAIEVFEDHPDHIIALAWYYVDTESKKVYERDIMSMELIPLN